MNLSTSFKVCVFEKYLDFKGRASRSEYWWFWFIYVFGVFGLPLISFIIEDSFNVSAYPLMILWIIAFIGLTCPFIAVSIRRLHDAGFSGWHYLWRIIPYAGFVITCILMCQKSASDVPNSEPQKIYPHKGYSIKDKKWKILCKKLCISLIVTTGCGVGVCSVLYFPIFILLFVYYQYLIWRKKLVIATDILLLPLLQRIGLYNHIEDNYILKKKLLVFAAILVGSIFIAYCTFILNINDYENNNEGIITGLFIIDLLCWGIFFFYEYGTQWLKNNDSNPNNQQ